MAPAAIVTLITTSVTLLTVLFGVGTWILNLREKRRVDAYVRKEQVYNEIVVALQALYRSDNTKQKATFTETTRVTEYVKANNRTCPQPTPWYKLWEMLWG